MVSTHLNKFKLLYIKKMYIIKIFNQRYLIYLFNCWRIRYICVFNINGGEDEYLIIIAINK